MLSFLDLHNKFHPNWTKIGKVSTLGWVRGVGVGGLGASDQKTFSSFELCSPFMTSTPIFIQIGPKLAKLVFWGRSGGYGHSPARSLGLIAAFPKILFSSGG